MTAGPSMRPGRPRPVLVYRDHLLRYSEIWVRSQGEAMASFRPYYAGSKRIGDIAMPSDRSFILNQDRASRAAEWLFKITGHAPGLYRWAEQVSPVLVHAHFGLDGVLMLPMARRLRVPLVVTFHGYDVMTKDAYAARSFYLHRKYLKRRPALIREGTLFIAVSRYIRDLLLEQGFPDERIAVHYIGVDVRLFTPSPEIQRRPVVLFVGRLSSEKGCDYLIRAMAEVQAARPEAELVVIGAGAERPRLESMARATLKRYQFLGVLPQPQIKTWLNRARVFCVPSLRIENGEGEAFGLVFAEAQAMGVPVVSFASGGIPEAVAHGSTGFLAPERDWRGLAGHMIDLLGNDVLWHRMSRGGRERVTRQFDLAVQTRALEDLYCGVLNATRAQAFEPRLSATT